MSYQCMVPSSNVLLSLFAVVEILTTKGYIIEIKSSM